MIYVIYMNIDGVKVFLQGPLHLPGEWGRNRTLVFV